MAFDTPVIFFYYTRHVIAIYVRHCGYDHKNGVCFMHPEMRTINKMPSSVADRKQRTSFDSLCLYTRDQYGAAPQLSHDNVIKWKHFPRYWPFARGIHRSPVNSPHKGQWRGALVFSMISVSINGWVNNSEAGVLRRPRGHYDVSVMNNTTSRRKS